MTVRWGGRGGGSDSGGFSTDVSDPPKRRRREGRQGRSQTCDRSCGRVSADLRRFAELHGQSVLRRSCVIHEVLLRMPESFMAKRQEALVVSMSGHLPLLGQGGGGG